MSALSEVLKQDVTDLTTEVNNLVKDGHISIGEMGEFVVHVVKLAIKTYEQIGTTPDEQKQNIIDVAGSVFDGLSLLEPSVFPAWLVPMEPIVNKFLRDAFVQLAALAYDKLSVIPQAKITLPVAPAAAAS